MKRATALLAALLGLLACSSVTEAAEWRAQQPLGAGIGVPVPLGEIGDIEFWAPNRGMLITAGNDGVPAGLFAFDGTGWYRYSTVCGGHEGRIAWAGPSEFWTISDQQVGQETGAAPARHISLCHFKDGQVVASYGEPLGRLDSYLPMSAAACAGPADCWFGGERLSGDVNDGAFHLHWDGGSLAPLPSPSEPEPELADPGRAVVSLAAYGGRFYESVAVRAGDVAPGEPASQPFFLHQIVAGPSPFAPLPVHGTIEYGEAGAGPEELEGFRLSGDGDGLWAISGALSAPDAISVLRKAGTEPFVPVPLLDPGSVLAAGDGVDGVAAEPGGEYAWVGFRRPGEFESAGPARLTRIHADGTVGAETVLPSPEEGIGNKGTAGPIACPSAGQCWMATSRGWLFHRGPDLPQDPDPALHALVTFRPRDDSLPVVPPDSLPEDDSGAYAAPEEPLLSLGEAEPLPKRARPLLTKLGQRLIGTTVELTFTLREKAHVQLLARRKGRIVGKTPRYTMDSGRHSLRLRLDPKRWPTKLDLEAHAMKKRGGR